MKNIQHHRNVTMEIGSIKYYAEVSGEGKPLVCLHGFSEDHTTWEHIGISKYASYRIDLIGHGRSSKPEDRKYYSMEAVLEQLHIFIRGLVDTNYSVMGYSMGGRIALAYALRYSDEIDRLVLESSGLGIGEEADRMRRRQSDQELAKRIEEEGVSWFQEYWSRLKIFDTQRKLPIDVREEIKRRRLQNAGKSLANMLYGCGQGVLPYYGEQIYQLPMPILYVSGGLDEKYSELGRQLAEKSHNTIFVQVKAAGHNVHLEQPEQFQQIVSDFLNDVAYRKE